MYRGANFRENQAWMGINKNGNFISCKWWYLNEPVICLDTQKKIAFLWLPFKKMIYL